MQARGEKGVWSMLTALFALLLLAIFVVSRSGKTGNKPQSGAKQRKIIFRKRPKKIEDAVDGRVEVRLTAIDIEKFAEWYEENLQEEQQKFRFTNSGGCCPLPACRGNHKCRCEKKSAYYDSSHGKRGRKIASQTALRSHHPHRQHVEN